MSNEIRQADPLFFVQLASFLAVAIVFVGLAVHATRRVLRRYLVKRDEARTTMWLAIIWLVPVLGPLFALLTADSIRDERKLGNGEAPSA